jgi:hypothetical protein
MKPKPSFIPAIAWLIITTILLIIPGKELPQESWFDKVWLDKWVHIGLFSLLVWLWCRGALTGTKRGDQLRKIFYLVALLAFMFGTAMEFVQKYYVPFRSFDGGDIIADGVGAALGLFYSARKYIKK